MNRKGVSNSELLRRRKREEIEDESDSLYGDEESIDPTEDNSINSPVISMGP